MTLFTKRSLIVTWVIISAVVAFFCWYGWDTGKNHGLSFGYYGQYNSVSNALVRLPDVRILNTGYNADVTLEEFSFEIEKGGRRAMIFFSEQNRIRRMSGSELNLAVSEMVNAELVSQAAR